jgi:hypothetical protein
MSIVEWLPAVRLIYTNDIPTSSPRSWLIVRAFLSTHVALFQTAGGGEARGGN